ncbi:MAG: amidohydrolase family protein [Paludibacteraceae bacterium]|nr:amidohydrolase family protein [Paludibacteraceae bacterium]
MKAYQANILFTPTPERFEMLEHGYVVVGDDGNVVGAFASLPDEYKSIELVDYGNQILIPAMNDLHVHAPQYRNLGIAMDMELLPWLNTYTFPEEAKYKDLAYAERMYRRFVRDLWKLGTMRAAIFATIHPEASCLLADLLNEAGMGGLVGLVGMDRNSPETLSNTVEEAVNGTLRVLEHTASMPLVSAIVTPRFVPSCTPEMMTALGRLANDKHLPVQSHLSENQSEIAWVKELEPESTCYGDAYRRYGMFGQTPTLMAHCCYTEGEEFELMRKNHVFAVHCPTSNCNLGSGIAPIRRFMNAGIPVALGSDVSGGSGFSIFRVIHYTLQMSKMKWVHGGHKEAFLSLSETFWLATKSGGSFFGKVGSFEPGYAFDALVIDDSDLNFDNYTLQHRLERYIYLGDDRQLTHRFCQGKEIPAPKIIES